MQVSLKVLSFCFRLQHGFSPLWLLLPSHRLEGIDECRCLRLGEEVQVLAEGGQCLVLDLLGLEALGFAYGEDHGELLVGKAASVVSAGSWFILGSGLILFIALWEPLYPVSLGVPPLACR